jgi:hypothetical protein
MHRLGIEVGIACFPFDPETSDALLTATAENELLYGGYAGLTELNDQR